MTDPFGPFILLHVENKDKKDHTYFPRMGSKTNHPGSQLVWEADKEGHVIGIHTGSTVDHELHHQRLAANAYDADGDGKVDGRNGLESDLIRAKQRIYEITNKTPQFVRSPTGLGRDNPRVCTSYEQVSLKHIYWDVDSYDSHRFSVENVKKQLQKRTKELIKSGKSELIILFHDTNNETVSSLEDYIDVIDKAVKEAGGTPVFAKTNNEVNDVLLQYRADCGTEERETK